MTLTTVMTYHLEKTMQTFKKGVSLLAAVCIISVTVLAATAPIWLVVAAVKYLVS